MSESAGMSEVAVSGLGDPMRAGSTRVGGARVRRCLGPRRRRAADVRPGTAFAHRTRRRVWACGGERDLDGRPAAPTPDDAPAGVRHGGHRVSHRPAAVDVVAEHVGVA
ncbi:hypothetical protein FHR81_005005 [Actinoalloteichus hoggarensis]|uniref:Uncharacterized protein n=1 Tax=Actinoalloteichus hoggarensis TaxID=1470176 RepID=A0A221W7V4_9PSEU|nr:hypothetical protein AHOG_21860 [Actinoalloteichus hoggarensis]MBB5923932.1 hypothetical protein [Actinoalloteichus hoggarensis]